MTTQVNPVLAGTGSDSLVLDTALLGGDTATLPFDMPSNTAVSQYELVKLSGSALAKIAGAPAAGDIVGICTVAADNLNATSASLRTTKVHVYVRGRFNAAKIVVPGAGGVIADWKAVCAGSNLRIETPLQMS